MTVIEFDDIEQGIEFQRIRARIRNTLSLPVDTLGQASGAATDPAKYVCVRSTEEPKDDLVTIFRRMLDIGSPDYEQQLATLGISRGAVTVTIAVKVQQFTAT